MTSTFGDRLNHLVETVHPASRGPLSNAEIAQELTRRGHKVTASYIAQLRRGARGKTGVAGQLVLHLASMFGVKPDYFYDDDFAEDTDQQLELIAALRDSGVERIATRSMGLSPDGLDAVEGLIEHLRKVDGMRASREKNRQPRDAGAEGGAG